MYICVHSIRANITILLILSCVSLECIVASEVHQCHLCPADVQEGVDNET